MKKTRVYRVAVLNRDYTYRPAYAPEDTCIPKGTEFSARKTGRGWWGLAGFVLVVGHGIYEVIPNEFFRWYAITETTTTTKTRKAV